MKRSKSSRALSRLWPYPRHAGFERHLRESAARWFKKRRARTESRRPYILASRDDWPKNIICSEVVDYIKDAGVESDRRQIHLHKYIHHGLSSQAMLFNLIGPLIVMDDLEPLRMAVEAHGVRWPSAGSNAEFEYGDSAIFNEDSGPMTSLDLVVKDQGGEPSLFIECKLAEKSFGGCSVFQRGDCDGGNPSRDFDECYLHFIGRRYWELMARHNLISEKIVENNTCILANNYQFFRELLFALESGGTFLLLSDERSPTFHCKGPSGDRGIMAELLKLVPTSLKPRIGSISTQDLVMAIKHSRRHSWITDFEKKYGLSGYVHK
jgi:hypothetical protein